MKDVNKILDKLEELYPDAKCELDYTTPFELLIATILSAQCTDVRVNIVTGKMFKKYNTPEAFNKLSIEEIIKEIAEHGVNGFVYNIDTLRTAKGVAVLSFVKGKSGTYDKEYITSKGNSWEVFDAGIACQTFCLAAHAKGVGTCIMGVIDDKSIAKIVNLPEDETVAALIVYGYEDGEHAAPNKRKDVDEIMRFVDR